MIRRVLNWLKLAKGSMPDKFTIPNKDTIELWYRIQKEELDETYKALLEGNIAEVKDGIQDQRVVLGNLVYFCGYSIEDYENDFNKVMDSNFSKFCKSVGEAEETCDLYLMGQHPNLMGTKVECYYKKMLDYYIILRKSDDKIMKSVGFQEAQIS